MTETGPAAGGAPVGAWRHRPRPARAVRIEPGRSEQPSSEPGGPQAPPEACPWLYLVHEPNARAAYVTDAHRCELRQDVVPGPGHQLAYCMTTNHISCPQLRSYEAQRQAGAPNAPGAASSVAPALAIEQEAAAASAAPPTSALRAPQFGGWLGRGGSAALGAVGAIVLLGALALLYASPGSTNTAAVPVPAPTEPSIEGEAPPPAATATPTPLPLPTTAPPAIAPAAPEPTADATASPTPEATPAPNSAPAPAPTPVPTPEPPPGPVLVPYVVQPGDTLMIIAATYDVDLDELLRANSLHFNSPIYYGQQLLLPLRVLPPQ